MNTPGTRRLGRREPTPPAIAERDTAAEDEHRRLLATVRRLRLELARLRGELDDAPAGGEAEAAELVGVAVDPDAEVEPEAHDPAAEAEARAAEAERRVRLLAEEVASEQRELERLAAALGEEREARLMLEALRDGLEGAMEEQRRRYEREVTDVQEAAEDRRTEQTLEHIHTEEQLRTDLGAARVESAALTERLEAEAAARSRAEERCAQLDREVDELRNWISAAESRRGLLRRVARRMTPPPKL
jgi:hypothetical protein